MPTVSFAGGVRHTLGLIAEALLVIAIIGALTFAVGTVTGHLAGGQAAFAKGSSAYSISVTGPSGAARTAFSYGSDVTTFSTYGKANPLYVRVRCTANSSTDTNLSTGSTVYNVYKVIREGSWNTDGYATFDTSASRGWTGGGADCSADLRTYSMHNANRVWKTLASVDFTVRP